MSTTAIGDAAQPLRQATEVFGRLKAAYDAQRDDECQKHLATMKGLLVRFPTFLSPKVASPTRLQEATIARETLEHAVLLCCRRKALDDMQAYYAQLRTYYHDFDGMPASERCHLLLGLNLMRLLVTSKISEFHAELETIPLASHDNLYVRFPLLLERQLMEGSYHRLLHSRAQVPSTDYLPLVEMLENTVRDEIARCIPKSFPSLGIAAAQSMLMLTTEKDTLAFGQKQAWSRSANGSEFVFGGTEADLASRRELPLKSILQEHVHYCALLQQVV